MVATGNPEVDKKIGGGIPEGSLSLIEGQSDSGKSVLLQQLIWGALQENFRIAYYTTENTTRSLLRQMESLGMNIMDHFLLGKLNVYPGALGDDGGGVADVLQPAAAPRVAAGQLRHYRDGLADLVRLPRAGARHADVLQRAEEDLRREQDVAHHAARLRLRRIDVHPHSVDLRRPPAPAHRGGGRPAREGAGGGQGARRREDAPATSSASKSSRAWE